MIQGVILNQSPPACRHLTPILEGETGLQVLRHIPDAGLCLASRHLGLHHGGRGRGLQEKILRLAGQMEESVDLDTLFAIAASAPLDCIAGDSEAPERRRDTHRRSTGPGFLLYYEDNLELLEELGAELVEFSP